MKSILPVFLIACAAALARAEEMPSAWPEGWRAAYVRFEKFLAERERSWPISELTISPEGAVAAGIFFEEDRESRQSLKLFQDGVGNIVSGLHGNGGSSPIFDVLLPRRLNAAVMQTTGVFGYQHIPPIVWFEVESRPGMEMMLFGGRDREIRVLPAPEPAEDFLPNERLLAWRDFQVLPKRFPHAIFEVNSKVSPAVFLQVDRGGTVRRERLPDADAEASLVWRVYFNGRLVKRAPIAEAMELDIAKHGFGNCTVLAGIDGPAGFFPVSNLLQFTLAPGEDGAPELLFSHFDYGRPQDYPAWYAAVLPPPLGTGPGVFDSAEELDAARGLASVWKGCADMYNAADAAWIFQPEGGDAP